MGIDKASIEIDGVPLWHRQVRLLEQLEPQEMFIAGPQRPQWSGYAVIADEEPHAGPVPVIAGALRRCATPLLLVLAVDLPHMTAGYLRTLFCGGSVPHGQPLCATYPAEAAPIADSCSSAQEFASRCAAAGLVRLLDIEQADEHLFFNMNTPADLATLTAHA